MYGAIIGDIVGSVYEFVPTKDKYFQPLFSPKCSVTDDSVMTAAVAAAIIAYHENRSSFKEAVVTEMQHLGREFPNAGYGSMFASWIASSSPEPYGSYGNGSAMRVSPCGIYASSLEETLRLARESAEVTHDHREGIAGAQAVAGAVFLAKTGADKNEIRRFVSEYYDMHRTLDQIRPTYTFQVSCQKSVPEAITAFLESENYEDAIRLAVSLGGDADTQAAIAGSIAWAYYAIHPKVYDREENNRILAEAKKYIPTTFCVIASKLQEVSAQHQCDAKKERGQST